MIINSNEKEIEPSQIKTTTKKPEKSANKNHLLISNESRRFHISPARKGDVFVESAPVIDRSETQQPKQSHQTILVPPMTQTATKKNSHQNHTREGEKVRDNREGVYTERNKHKP